MASGFFKALQPAFARIAADSDTRDSDDRRRSRRSKRRRLVSRRRMLRRTSNT